ncbi:MAG: CYTH domain-containing protein [Bacillus sp. (in: firmicutes)]
MNQEIEIEFKNMLTESEFEKLQQFLSIREDDFFIQENHYFDTIDFDLKAQQSALRIRKKGDGFEMTLKQPHESGLLETNETLSETEALQMIEQNKLPACDMSRLLAKAGIQPDTLQYFGKLQTRRAEVAYQGGCLVLDHSRYLGIEDFELEYEVSDYAEGEKNFRLLLKELNIPLRKTDNKIKRFYRQKYRLQ